MHSIYQKRPIRYIELYQTEQWKIKIYSISSKQEMVDTAWIQRAKQQLPIWLMRANDYPLNTYKIATLILHEGKEGCFAIICWWIDENMLQLFVYLAPYTNPQEFQLYSDKGIVTCVWEMAVLWHERNVWVKHVLMHPENPNMTAYLKDTLNDDL